MDPREELQKVVDALSTQRDELIVQAHLAKLEAEDEWGELEVKLASLRASAEAMADTAAAVGQEVGREVATTAKELGADIARGYDRLRGLF